MIMAGDVVSMSFYIFRLSYCLDIIISSAIIERSLKINKFIYLCVVLCFYEMLNKQGLVLVIDVSKAIVFLEANLDSCHHKCKLP